ncbi:MAG TPA: hypothetical protein VM638_03825, partial [Actinomycetota bacterium]|nr:hypothetical protein [Actinomycetota bacterium]
LASLAEQDVVRRIWERDHTVWTEDQTEISDRLGWLEAVDRSREELPDLRAFVNEVRRDGLTRTILLGMGGSSLAPEVIRHAFYDGTTPTFDLSVLDTTHPDALARVETAADRALFLVASKSGTTIETRSHMSYFLDRIGDGSRFAAITDPGTPLERDAAEHGFRRVFAAPRDVGGRYSALTVFGLLSAALCGVDPEMLLVEAAEATRACLPEAPIERNPGAVLGAILGEAALAGRDKLTLWPSLEAAPLGAWIEQLVAESTGKRGRGILPVDDEPRVDRYGDDRLFLGIGERPPHAPSVGLPFGRPAEIGALFFILEMATAVAGHVLGIHPFDQPDVQEAKERTARVLEEGAHAEEPTDGIDGLLGDVRPGDYVAIQAFVDPTPPAWERLQRLRERILRETGAATTLGFGPRYLHSTGQLHKGGPATGHFVQVVDEPREDRKVPGRPYTFGELIAAQAAGDLAALRARGRPIVRARIEDLA